jgi:hypothetical protein
MWSPFHITGPIFLLFVLQLLQSPIVVRAFPTVNEPGLSSCNALTSCECSTQHTSQIVATPSWLQTDHVTWNRSTIESFDAASNNPPCFGVIAVVLGPLDIANLTTASVLRFGTRIDANRLQDRLERASTTSYGNVLTLEDLLALSSSTSIDFAARWYSIFAWPPLHPSTQLPIAYSSAKTSYPYIFGRAVASLKARARFKLTKPLSQVFSVRTETVVILLINSLTHVNF